MPKGGKLDRCHEKTKKSLIKQGKSEQEAERIAWVVCKKQEKERLEKEKTNTQDKKSVLDKLKTW